MPRLHLQYWMLEPNSEVSVENGSGVARLPALLQLPSRQVWIQALGRALYQAGYGSIQFYIPLIFVSQIGLSATTVGFGIGSGSLAGVFGHLLGGYLADSQTYGRRRTLLLSAGLSILATVVLVLAQDLPMLVIANLLLGLSAGCYWTAADAAVIDVTTPEQRERAFAVLILADSFGGGLGVWGGGALLTLVTQPQTLFLCASLIFLIFLVLIHIAIAETRQDELEHSDPWRGFVVALQDRSLQLFVLVNVLFTTYIALVNSILPLYLTKVISTATVASEVAVGPALGSVANLFTWCYIGFGAVLQLPIVQMLNSVQKVRVLMISMLLWSAGFFLVGITGTISSIQSINIIAALGILSIATAVYKPFAPTIVAGLAPKPLRGIYLAISYQCWSIGYFVGPILGGWAMDRSQTVARNAWIVAAISTICGLVVLHFLGQNSTLTRSTQVSEDTASVT